MAVADAAKTADALKTIGGQADAALIGALTILRALVRKDLLSAEDAAEIATETVSAVRPSHRQKVLAFIATFLPDYRPPQFSPMGPGVLPHFGRQPEE